MNRPLTAVILALLLTAPLAAIDAKPNDPTKGLANACERSGNKNPCEKAGLIPDTTVGAGQSKTYSGQRTATGTVVVEAGGTVVVQDAQITMTGSSGGFVAKAGGTLRILDSTLTESGGSVYTIIAEAGSILEIARSQITGGDGIIIATESSTFNNNTVQEIPLALRLQNVSVLIEQSTFLNNTVAVNQTGGSPALSFNQFLGGQTCVRDWRTNPTINDNVFRGCHVGIWHEQSESTLVRNDMEDQAVPPGIGIAVIDTQSPVIEGNDIRNYGTGILIQNARAYVRNNTIHHNVADGIRVLSNSLTMDIQGNYIHHNGGNGITLSNVHDIPVWNNLIANNSGIGISVNGAVYGHLQGNTIVDSGGRGIDVANAPYIQIIGNVVERADVFGIGTGASSPFGLFQDNVVSYITNGGGMGSHSPNTMFINNTAHHTSDAGIIARGNGSIIQGANVHNNTHGGLAVQLGIGMLVEDVQSRDNRVGLDVNSATGTFRRIEASGNIDHGVWFQANNGGMTTFEELRSTNNGWSGFFNVWGNLVSASNSTFMGNGIGVVNSQGTSPLDFENNYWGSPTGPTHAGNPGGTGDTVQGQVDYDPFLTSDPTA